MILNDTPAGNGLKLWCGEEALIREGWESEVSLLLQGHQFQRVYTPFIYTKKLHETFDRKEVGNGTFPPVLVSDWWVEPLTTHPVVPPSKQDFHDELAFLDKIKECSQYVYLGHKGLCHILIMQEGQVSYKDLPIRLFEFSEVYDDNFVNSAGLYLSVMCEPSKLDEMAAAVYAIMLQTSGKLRLDKFKIRPGITTKGELVYITANGRKDDAGLILARMRYDI